METLDKIIKLINDGRNIFITGGGGVGKSYLLNQLREIYDITVTSSTGISAVNIDGQTLHRWAHIGIGQIPWMFCANNILKHDLHKKDILDCKILAIDEISMISSGILEYINKVVQKVRGNKKPMGGIQTILIGDFFQLPPVNLGKTQELGLTDKVVDVPVDYCFNSKLWKDLKLEAIMLTEVHRQDNKELANALNNIRSGNVSKEDIKLFEDRNGITPPETAIRIYSTNREVDRYNQIEYNKLTGKEYKYEARDKFYKGKKIVNPWDKDSQLTDNQKKVMEEFDKNCKAQREIKLKVGARVMLLQNINIGSGLCNGTCGYVKQLRENSVLVEFDNNTVRWIESESFQLHSKGELLIEREQIPLMLAYSATIHKVQGMTLDKVAIDMKRIFDKGQCYVALSRVTSLDGLYLNNFDKSKIMVDPNIINFYNKG